MTMLTPFGLTMLALLVLAIAAIIAVWVHDRKKA